MAEAAKEVTEVLCLGPNTEDCPCLFCGDEPAEHSVKIKFTDHEYPDESREWGPWNLCGTCLLREKFEARDHLAYMDHVERSPFFDDEGEDTDG